MKKFFFILLCVGACLSVSAAVSNLNLNKFALPGTKPIVGKLEKKALFPKRHKAPVACDGKNVLPINQFFTERGVTPDDNLLMKKAPRRVDAQDLLSTKLPFMMCYEYDDNTGEMVLSNNYFEGGWDVEMEQVDDGLYNAYLLYSTEPVNISVDLSSRTAELESGCLAVWQWADTTVTGIGSRKTTTIADTTEYVYLLDEGYVVNGNEEVANIQGTVYNDGSLYFPDGWCCVFVDYVTTTVTTNGNTTETNDTIWSMTPFYRNTYLMTPNAVHDFDYTYKYLNKEYTDHYTMNAYMYQYDDTTAVAWNLYGMGGRGVRMYIHGDGSMAIPAFQVVGTMDVSVYEEYYPEYDWSEGYETVMVGVDMETDENYFSDIMGEVTSQGMTWAPIEMWNYCKLDDQYYVLSSYPYHNNELYFTNGEEFVFDTSLAPVIVSEELDDKVVVTAQPTAEDGVAYLFDSQGSQLENPYMVMRTDEDQYVTFYAVEYDYGKNVSELVVTEIFVPRLEQMLAGDVNKDNVVNLQDVIVLIDAIVNDNYDAPEGFSSNNADIDQDGDIDLNDVVSLITMIVEAK